MTGLYNPVIGVDPWTSLATFTATAAAGYPASNLGTMDFNQVYRATGTSATIDVVLSRPVPVGLVVLCRHNFTQGADFNLKLYSDNALATLRYDSAADAALVGSQDAWPLTSDPTELDLEDDNCFTCQYRTEELAGDSWDRPIWLGDARYLIQSLRVTINNARNPAGFVQFGHMVIARGKQLSRGISVQSASGYAAASVISAADGGREYGQRKMKPRVFQGTFPTLPRAEAELLKELKRRHDIVPEDAFYWHPYPQDPTLWTRNSFMARHADLGLHQIASPVRDAVPISLRQVM